MHCSLDLLRRMLQEGIPVFQVAITQFEGATMLRVPPLAAGLLASTLRRAPDLRDVTIEIYAARLPIDLAAAALAEADLAGISLYTFLAARFATTAPTIRALTTGVLEETLRCDPARATEIRALGQRADVELVEQLTATAPIR